MKEISISASRRESLGKGPARQSRMAGNIPAVVYGPEVEPIPVAVEERSFRATMKATGSLSSIINLDVDGKTNKVVLREIQRDPITSRILHMDFHAISMTKPLNISIPIQFEGSPRGVKTDGGIMQITMRDLDISCLPSDIPDKLVVDVEDLGIGDSIHVRDVDLDKVQILSPEQRTIVVIAAPTVVKVDEPAEAEEGLEEGAEEGAEDSPAEGETADAKDAPKDDKGK
ncbi:MAG: 50S ribosomal protein L25 [candidate division Zixibacteria bacterium]|nr:50S ribosomal protein L25 [candidate division Zixibacteria bacterium]MDH3936856.1 50S ribosomal protein L25 [candidate division Zixibacteria bacterium]